MGPTASRIASRWLEAAEPPLHKAAEADEWVGDAYRALASLKAGFDSWEEIPSRTEYVYSEISKAMSLLSAARQSTNQVREMIRRNRF